VVGQTKEKIIVNPNSGEQFTLMDIGRAYWEVIPDSASACPVVNHESLANLSETAAIELIRDLQMVHKVRHEIVRQNQVPLRLTNRKMVKTVSAIVGSTVIIGIFLNLIFQRLFS